MRNHGLLFFVWIGFVGDRKNLITYSLMESFLIRIDSVQKTHSDLKFHVGIGIFPLEEWVAIQPLYGLSSWSFVLCQYAAVMIEHPGE